MNLQFYGETVARHGVANTLYYGLSRCMERLTHAVLWDVLILTMDRVDTSLYDEPPAQSVEEVTPQALAPYAGIDNTLNPDFLAAAAARRDRCFALFEGRRLASYAWYASRPTPLLALGDDVQLEFDPCWAYMHNGFTHPADRGRRLYPLAIAVALRKLAAEGRRGLIAYVATTNFASLKAGERLGFERVGRLAAARVNGRLRCHFTRGCDPLGLRALPRQSRSA